MLELVRQLIIWRSQGRGVFNEGLPIIRAIVHSEALAEIVRATGTPIDDLVLQILRMLIPRE